MPPSSAPTANGVPSTSKHAEHFGGLTWTQLQPPGQARSWVQPQAMQRISASFAAAETLAVEIAGRVGEHFEVARLPALAGGAVGVAGFARGGVELQPHGD